MITCMKVKENCIGRMALWNMKVNSVRAAEVETARHITVQESQSIPAILIRTKYYIRSCLEKIQSRYHRCIPANGISMKVMLRTVCPYTISMLFTMHRTMVQAWKIH